MKRERMKGVSRESQKESNIEGDKDMKTRHSAV